ncbi:hypothetical protein FRC08_003181 [Ceratobasidium sp. 394]|nr:hypothetical protein FRC08_003181 [Ceratobasidium sp. 394]
MSPGFADRQCYPPPHLFVEPLITAAYALTSDSLCVIHSSSLRSPLYDPRFRCAIIFLPLVTIETRSNLDKVEAWMVIYGLDREFGSYDMVRAGPLEVPSFWKRFEAENADPDVIVKPLAFQDLNVSLPNPRDHSVQPNQAVVEPHQMLSSLTWIYLALASENRLLPNLRDPASRVGLHGIRGEEPHVIAITTANYAWYICSGAVDILAMIRGIECVVSSVIILLRDIQSPSSSNFPYSPGFPRSLGFASQLQNHSFAETTLVMRPQPVHRHTMSSTRCTGSATTPVSSDPLTTSSHSRRLYASPATLEVGLGVHVTIQTTVRGDSSYFSRASGPGMVILGDEERLPPHPNQRYRTGGDYFSVSEPSMVRMGSVNGS